MRTASKKSILLLTIALMSVTLLSGCTNWKKKYLSLNVEHENLRGLLDRERAEKGQIADQFSASQQTIAELQKKIDEQNQTPAIATGFGEGYDVNFDAEAGTVTVTLENSILFSSGKASLKSATSKELDHIQSVLSSEYTGKQVDVVGHTDADPIKKSKWKDNWELSAQRSLSVTRYLVEHGFSPDTVRAVGCGEARPVASNTSSAGKSKNRRVEIVVHVRDSAPAAATE